MWRKRKGKFGRWNKPKSKGNGTISEEISRQESAAKKDGFEEGEEDERASPHSNALARGDEESDSRVNRRNFASRASDI